MRRIIIFLFILFFAFGAFAHQPRIVSEKLTEIKNPDISQAFYGKLTGEPSFYEIKSEEPFNLYVGITVPRAGEIREDFLIEISKDGKILEVLDGKTYEWVEFYEEFGRDYYFNGPEFQEDVEAGDYKIKVSNPDNLGNYVLVIGAKEEFPINEVINVYKTLPKIKAEFFNKSPADAFLNIFSLFLLIFVIIIGGGAGFVAYLIKRRMKK